MQTSEKTLENELREVQSQIDALESNLDVRPDFGLREGDPRITRQEVDRVLLEKLKSRLGTLQQALKSVAKGTYGICELCGEPIHPDRLAVLPDTRLCVACARKQ